MCMEKKERAQKGERKTIFVSKRGEANKTLCLALSIKNN